MKSVARIFFVGFCVIFVCRVNAERARVLELRTLSCSNYAAEWLKNFHCELVQRNHTSFINIHIVPQKAITRFNVRIVLEYFMASGVPFKLLDTNVDGCAYLKLAKQGKNTKIVLKYLKKFVNYIPVCPLEENFNYTVNELYVDEEDIPITLPEVAFRVLFYISEQVGTWVGVKVEIDGRLWRSNKINGK